MQISPKQSPHPPQTQTTIPGQNEESASTLDFVLKTVQQETVIIT